MRAAILHQLNVQPVVEEVNIDDQRDGEVLVRIAASGICGDRVIVAMGGPCGHCAYCSRGLMQFCIGAPAKSTFGEMNDGSYRGGVGLSIIQGARIAGAGKIIAVDTNPAKLDLAANFGASHSIIAPEDPKQLDAEVCKIAELGVDFAFDAVGTRPERLQELMGMTQLGGPTVAIGVLGVADVVPVLGGDLLYGARRLAGVRGGNGYPGFDIPRILDLYQTGRLKLDELVGASYGLDDLSAAFDSADRAEHGRAIVRITPSLL